MIVDDSCETDVSRPEEREENSASTSSENNPRVQVPIEVRYVALDLTRGDLARAKSVRQQSVEQSFAKSNLEILMTRSKMLDNDLQKKRISHSPANLGEQLRFSSQSMQVSSQTKPCIGDSPPLGYLRDFVFHIQEK